MRTLPPLPLSDEPAVHYRRLGGFVLASLLLHILVVGLWRSEPPAGQVGRSTFQVTLVARQGDSQSRPGAESGQMENSAAPQPEASTGERDDTSTATRESPAPAPKVPEHLALVGRFFADQGRPVKRDDAPENRSAKSSLKVKRERPVLRPAQNRKTALEQKRTTRGSPDDGRHNMTMAAKYQRVRAALSQALLPYFEYPGLARRRGWQGRVKVGLHVEADGALSRIKLLESSGYAVLDNAAIRNVSRVRNLPGALQWLDGNGMEVVLPVSYRLDSPKR